MVRYDQRTIFQLRYVFPQGMQSFKALFSREEPISNIISDKVGL